jgi:hypothetical protein
MGNYDIGSLPITTIEATLRSRPKRSAARPAPPNIEHELQGKAA